MTPPDEPDALDELAVDQLEMLAREVAITRASIAGGGLTTEVVQVLEASAREAFATVRHLAREIDAERDRAETRLPVYEAARAAARRELVPLPMDPADLAGACSMLAAVLDRASRRLREYAAGLIERTVSDEATCQIADALDATARAMRRSVDAPRPPALPGADR